MPKHRGRRGEANGGWEPKLTVDNDSVANGSKDRVGSDDFGDDNDYDLVGDNMGGTRPYLNKPVSSPQAKHSHELVPWTETLTETLRSMGAAQKAIKHLQDRFKSHEDDLKMVDETRESLTELREQYQLREEEIRRLNNTITTLIGRNSEIEEKVKREMEGVEKEKQELQQQKEKSDKRFNIMKEEERAKLKSELDKLVLEQGQSHDKRKKELEDDFNKQRNENNRQVAILAAEKKQLSTTVEEQKKIIELQAKRLEKKVDYCEVLERANDSVKKEKLALDKELKMMKTEFALSSQSKDNLTHKFADIYEMIKNISLEYFHEFDGHDLETIHEQLVKADSHLASVPIGNSEDSHDLITAHAQRIISTAICENIWKPFCSEFTFAHPDWSYLLAKIAAELEKSSQGGRAANVWRALTMRALQDLPADLESSGTSGVKEPLRHNDSLRAAAVVSEVFSRFSPLISSSQTENLRTDLLKLANSTTEIWNVAQTGEFKIAVLSKLDPAHHEEWRSQMFNPGPSGNYENNLVTSQTRPRIFTLFPRVVAWGIADLNKDAAGPPGSWPLDSDLASRTIETYIHHGIGLSESSPLVVRGKEEQEERNKFLLKVIADAKKEIHSDRRHASHGERSSIGSSNSVPSSPSQQWKMGSVMKFTEK